MKIWTTKSLADTFSPDKKFTLEIRLPLDIQISFLQNAIAGDMALMELPEDYIEFLAAAKVRGIHGPFIFISPEPTIIEEQLKRYNAIILDKKKNAISEIREVVNFIAKLTMERDLKTAFGQDTAGEISAVEFETRREGAQIKDPLRIKQVLEYILHSEIPVIISIYIFENGEPVTARGLCRIEVFSGKEIVLHRFTPYMFPEIIRENTQIKLVLSHSEENFDTVSTVLQAGQDKLHVTVPEALFVEKRRNIRVEPNRKKPVLLYILKKNEPTTACRVVDISIGGLCFETGIELIKGSIYGFTIALPEERGIVLGYGKILYRRSVASIFRYGVQLNIHPGDEERIAYYIMNREKEIASLLTHYSAQKT